MFSLVVFFFFSFFFVVFSFRVGWGVVVKLLENAPEKVGKEIYLTVKEWF